MSNQFPERVKISVNDMHFLIVTHTSGKHEYFLFMQIVPCFSGESIT